MHGKHQRTVQFSHVAPYVNCLYLLYKFFFDDIAYKLREDLTLESDTKIFKNEKYTLKQFFCAGVVNRKLIEYFQYFDFRDIIIHKINLIGIDRIDKFSNLFSGKEKDIINVMFGTEKIQKVDAKKLMKARIST